MSINQTVKGMAGIILAQIQKNSDIETPYEYKLFDSPFA